MSTVPDRFCGKLSNGADIEPDVRPRRTPICNTLALILPLIFGLWGFLTVTGMSGFAAFGAGIAMIIIFFCLSIPISLLFAVVSLIRREKLFPLSVAEVATYSVILCLTVNEITK